MDSTLHGGEHKGLDLSDGSNTPLYSIVNGIITNKGYDATGFGNYIVMKDSVSKLGFLYGHMKEASNLNVGDTVYIGSFIGYEGTTGNSTGNHLHIQCLDMTNLNSWQFGLPISSYTNPCSFLGIPNVTGTRVYYNGVPRPPTPSHTEKNMWKWKNKRNFRIIY